MRSARIGMSESPVCPQCGTANTPGANFCLKCGGSLAKPSQPPPPTVASPTAPLVAWPPPAYDYTGTFTAQQRITEINRTSTGLLLLLIGFVLGPIPFLNFIGGILDIIGAFMVILGRGVFGPTHSRNVILAVIIYIVGLAIVIGSVVALFFATISAAISASNGGAIDPAVLSQSLSSSLQTLLIGTAIGGAVSGVAIVLFTYAIQNQTGRILLLTGYAASICISIVTILIVAPLISNAVAQSLAGSSYDPVPVNNIQSQAQAWGLLGFIPAILYACAFYLVRSRIDKGRVLKPSSGPAS